LSVIKKERPGPAMPYKYLKLKRNDIARLQFIFEGHEGLGTCSTIDKIKAVVKLFIMPDFTAEAADLIDNLKKEIEFEEIKSPLDTREQ
jgi:hypothetical protein